MMTCRIINITYHLKITAVIPRAINSSIDVPITIGNVPLSANQSTAPVPLPNAMPGTNYQPPPLQLTGPTPPPLAPQPSGPPPPPSVPQPTDPPVSTIESDTEPLMRF